MIRQTLEVYQLRVAEVHGLQLDRGDARAEAEAARRLPPMKFAESGELQPA